MRRLHSRILGWGGICGLPPTSVTEVLLKGLPPPSEAHPAKYHRFKQEAALEVASSEPFFDFVDVAAGAKHFAFVTREGNIVLIGNNRYGQVGQPTNTKEDPTSETIPYYYDLFNTSPSSSAAGCEDESIHATEASPTPSSTSSSTPESSELVPNAVVCGSNFSIFYRRGSTAGYCVGNNHHGQLGLGHKEALDNRLGLAGWADLDHSPWLQHEAKLLAEEEKQVVGVTTSLPGDDGSRHRQQHLLGVANVVCGFNHTMIQMMSGRWYACGTNVWGELGLGNTTAPMWPTEIRYLRDHGIRVKNVAAGSSFTLFLTEEGRVYGCGATQFGQLPSNCFDPTAIPLQRLDSSSEQNNGKQIRIKHIACTADAAIYVSVKDEILIQGSFPELGISINHPRYRLLHVPIDNDDSTSSSSVGTQPQPLQHQQHQKQDTTAKKRKRIVALHSGANYVLVQCSDGSLYGLGSNVDGQLTLKAVRNSSSKTAASSGVAYSQSFFIDALCELPIPAMKHINREEDNNNSDPIKFALSSSGCLLLDHGGVYGDARALRETKPMDLPHGGRAAPKTTRDGESVVVDQALSSDAARAQTGPGVRTTPRSADRSNVDPKGKEANDSMQPPRLRKIKF